MAEQSMGGLLFKRLAGDATSAQVVSDKTDWKIEPPTFEEFVTSKKYLGRPPMSRRQKAAADAILGDDPKRVFTNRDLPLESVLCWGKGSGKDYESSSIISYICCLLLCMRDPHTFLNLGPDAEIAIINIATNAAQAKSVFFDSLGKCFKAQWFQQFNPQVKKQEVIFPDINLILFSMHAEHESWEGHNVIAWVMDEASAFRTKSGGEDNAEDCYQVLRTSAQSRFIDKRWIGIIISFPRRQIGDFTLEKYKEAKDNPEMFADIGATWDINPKYDPGHPMFVKDMEFVVLDELNVRVPKPLAAEFKRNPTDCKTKYLCQPPPQEGGFFEIPRKLTDAVNHALPQLFYTTQRVDREVSARNAVTGEEETMVLHYIQNLVDSFIPKLDGCEYFMHGDPGLQNDAFAVCVCHTLPDAYEIVDYEGNEIEVNKVVVDFVISWTPKHDSPVDIANVEDFMLRACRYYGIQRVTFDKWNSAPSIQRLVNNGIYAEDMSFSNPQQFSLYRNLKMLVYNGLIEFPDDEETINELMYLKVNNNKIDHDVFGKDRADAVAAAAWAATGNVLSEAEKLIRETVGDAFGAKAPSQSTTVRTRWK